VFFAVACPSGGPINPTLSRAKGPGDYVEQAPALLFGLDSEPLKVLSHADVGVKAGRVGVEMKEGSSAPIEDARAALDQLCTRPQFDQEGLDRFKVLGPSVSHCHILGAKGIQDGWTGPDPVAHGISKSLSWS
jgi:hypothetical protein